METEILNLHKQANIYKNLCIFAPYALKFDNGAKVYDNWIKLDAFVEKITNFKGVLYKKEDEYVICYLGTDSKSVQDHIANLVMGLAGKSMQMRIANYFYSLCKRRHKFYNENLTLIGHSEGGTGASYVAVKNNIKTVVFNPYGLSSKLYNFQKDYSHLVTNYRDEADLVSKLKNNIGQTFIVPSTVKQCFFKKFFGSIKAHKIQNFGDCEKAVALDEYKKSHKCFLNSYKIFKKL